MEPTWAQWQSELILQAEDAGKKHLPATSYQQNLNIRIN